MSTFALDISNFAKAAGDKMDIVVKKILIDITARVDQRSPVGQPEIWASNVDRVARGLPPLPKGYLGGRFRGNWQLGVNVKPTGVLDVIDPSGEMTQGNVLAAIPDKAAGHVYFYMNNLPYAQRLEDGWSHIQQPLGIVKLAVLEWQGIVRSRASES